MRRINTRYFKSGEFRQILAFRRVLPEACSAQIDQDPPPEQHVIDVVEVLTHTDDFAFLVSAQPLMCIPRRGSPVARRRADHPRVMLRLRAHHARGLPSARRHSRLAGALRRPGRRRQLVSRKIAWARISTGLSTILPSTATALPCPAAATSTTRCAQALSAVLGANPSLTTRTWRG